MRRKMKRAIFFSGASAFPWGKLDISVQDSCFLARKLDLDERKLFILRMHARFSTMQVAQPTVGHASVLLQNRSHFFREVCWSHVTHSPEIFSLTVFKNRNGLANVFSNWRNVLWFGSYYTAKFEKFFFFAQNVHVADVVRLPFGQFFDSTHTNLIE